MMMDYLLTALKILGIIVLVILSMAFRDWMWHKVYGRHDKSDDRY